jgi:hypothetical protein
VGGASWTPLLYVRLGIQSDMAGPDKRQRLHKAVLSRSVSSLSASLEKTLKLDLRKPHS